MGICDAPAIEPTAPYDSSYLYAPDGVYTPPLDLTPPEKDPIVYCGDTESAPTQPTASSDAAGQTPADCDPVDFVTGYKMEQETDLTVALPGRDFHLIRHYSSNPVDTRTDPQGGALEGGALFGRGWSSPLFQELILEPGPNSGPDILVLRNKRQNMQTRFCEVSAGLWRSCGPADDTVSFDTVTEGQLTIDVYRVSSPGSGETLFLREGDLQGHIWQQRDEFGNAIRFQYRKFANGSTRLHRVYLNGADQSNCAAMVEFGYALVDPTLPSADALNGRVARATVYRFRSVSGSRQPIETHRVEYTYKHAADSLSPDLGRPGDLVQVVKYSRVDIGAPSELDGKSFGPSYPHRASVTQYRYHDGTQRSGNAEERLNVSGPPHGLKSVFRAEQIEYYAELLNRGNTWLSDKAFGVRDAAYRLMLLPDRATAVSWAGETRQVFELASKIVGYDESGASVGVMPVDARVSRQYLQAGGCACAGAAHPIRKDYARLVWNSGGVDGVTMRVEEFTRAAGAASWTLHHRRWIDAARVNGSDAFYGVNAVLEEPNGTPTGFTRRWITHYVYDTSRNLAAVWTPEACAALAYTPAAVSGGSVTPPLLSGSPASGLVLYYLYNAQNRLIERGVRQGAAGTAVPVVRVEYDASNTSTTRTHLPKKIERIADPAAGANGVETVTFSYEFRAGTNPPTPPNAIAAIRSTVEAERPEENGPTIAGGGAAKTYGELKLLNEAGQIAWSAASDGVLTRREYDPRSGGVTLLQVNADPAGMPASMRAVYNQWLSEQGLTAPYTSGQPSVTVEITRDDLGRVVSTKTPGPSGGTVETQWVYGYGRMDAPGLDERPGAPFAFYALLPHRWVENGQTRFSGPIGVSWVHADGAPVMVSRFAANPGVTYDRLNLFKAGLSPHGTEVYRRILRWSLPGTLSSFVAWHDVTGALGRPVDDRAYEVSFEYDELGRLSKSRTHGGDVRELKYDLLGRVTGEWRGTASGLQQVAAFFYDSNGATSQGVGNGKLTVLQAFPGEGATRTQKLSYDWRNRLVSIENPGPPHSFFTYDNLDRVVEAATFSSAAAPASIGAASRGSYRKVFYSQRGTVYKAAVAIDPGNLGSGFLESHAWYDSVGRVRASWGPDSPALKVSYDPLGMAARAFLTDRASDPAPGQANAWEAALSVADDTVLEQSEFDYTATGYLSMARRLMRRHDLGPGGGPLLATDPAPTGIATHTGYLYDANGRPSRVVEFGTNKAPDAANRLGDSFSNGPTPTWPPAGGVVPNWDTPAFADQIVTAYEYDAIGRLASVVDPKGRRTRSVHDDLGRVIATVENASGSSGSWGVGVAWSSAKGRWAVTGLNAATPDVDRVTSFAHTRVIEGGQARWALRQAAHVASAGTSPDAQVTEVVYGVAAGSSSNPTDSLLASAELAREIRFPDEATGEPGTTNELKVRYAYNRLGERRAVALEHQGLSPQCRRPGIAGALVFLLQRLLADLGRGGRGLTEAQKMEICESIESLPRSSGKRSAQNAPRWRRGPHQLADATDARWSSSRVRYASIGEQKRGAWIRDAP